MTIEHFDAIVIGAGQAGPALAARCSKEGLRTAVIERGHFGGIRAVLEAEGMSEHEVRASGRQALMGKMPMQRVGRAREAGETQGFMKVLVDAENQRILGAAILDMKGDEVVHSLLGIMASDQPYTVCSRAVHIQPTVSELLPTLLQQLRPMQPLS